MNCVLSVSVCLEPKLESGLLHDQGLRLPFNYNISSSSSSGGSSRSGRRFYRFLLTTRGIFHNSTSFELEFGFSLAILILNFIFGYLIVGLLLERSPAQQLGA